MTLLKKSKKAWSPFRVGFNHALAPGFYGAFIFRIAGMAVAEAAGGKESATALIVYLLAVIVGYVSGTYLSLWIIRQYTEITNPVRSWRYSLTIFVLFLFLGVFADGARYGFALVETILVVAVHLVALAAFYFASKPRFLGKTAARLAQSSLVQEA